MNDLRVSPHDIDPDDLIRLFVPEGHTIDQKNDRRLWALAEKLAAAFSARCSRRARGTLLEVSFPDSVADPEPVIAKLAELLPGRLTPGPAVAACVKPALFRTAGEPDQSTGSIARINRSDQ